MYPTAESHDYPDPGWSRGQVDLTNSDGMEQNRLHELEDQCIQECAAPCTARCPVHVDIRQLALALAAGDFALGRQAFAKAVPFPGIIARICDQPCQAECNRKTLGGVIQISQLEQSCLAYADLPRQKTSLLPKKGLRVAVIGGGLSGLTAAFDLVRKGYPVDLYEQSDRLGGRMLDLPVSRLPGAILDQETGRIAELGVRIHPNERVTSGHALFSEADAIYLGSGKYDSELSLIDLDADGVVRVNPETFQTSRPQVFAGGSLLHPCSPIVSISDGRRAAISIDRFLQKVSLTASRSNEGAYPTRLFTSLAGREVVGTILPGTPAAGYTREEAQAEARRCLQCECMECVKVCEYLKHYGSYPRKYVREIYNNMSMLVRARTSNRFINSCALCGLCAEVCPTDLDMGQVNLETRQEMVRTSRMPAAAHDFALQDMAFSNGEQFALARHAPGFESSEYAFFPGCQLSGSSPQYVERAYALLRASFQEDGIGIGLMLRCCGAPADWAGRDDLVAASRAEFLAAHASLGRPKLILACSSCYRMFQKHFPELEILSFWDLLDQHGPKELTGAAFPGPMALHDPCATRYEGHIQDSVRSLLKKAGVEVRELPLNRERSECCSYGGLMWLANKEVAEEVVRRRIHESPLDYVTYCAMCRDFFARRGKRTLHVLDILFAEPGSDPAGAPPVGWSQRHENRTRLKAKLLHDLWSESMPDPSDFASIRLVLPEAIQQKVEERLVLLEDMQKVIEHAERTGKRLFNPSTGHSLAYFKPNRVTYWVEYSPQEDGSFLIHKAYSHRMEIAPKEKP